MQLTVTPEGNNAIKKLSWWHESIIDWMIMNPDATLGKCAETFNVTQPWLSRIVNSHLFKERFRERRARHSENVSFTMAEKLESLAEAGLEAMIDRVISERDTMPIAELRSTSEMALATLGYVTKRAAQQAPAQQAPAVQVNMVTREALQESSMAWQRLAEQPPAAMPVQGATLNAEALPLQGSTGPV